MELIIDKHIIDTDMNIILHDLRRLCNERYLKDIIPRGENVAITCPHHKDGNENHPSCYVYNSRSSKDVPYGWYRCFTCREQGPLYKLVSVCTDMSIETAKQWLIENYSHTYA